MQCVMCIVALLCGEWCMLFLLCGVCNIFILWGVMRFVSFFVWCVMCVVSIVWCVKY